MPTSDPHAHLSTHEVLNQPVPPAGRDLWAGDPVLRHWCDVAGAPGDTLAGAGARLGGAALFEAGREARRDTPRLVPFDRTGRRLDEVHFAPAYHQLMGAARAEGYTALPWEGAPGGHAGHAALVYMLSQVEPGICCPLTMTYAAHPAMAATPALAAIWQPRLAARDHDPATLPAAGKSAVTLGMAMTEKQGGSDVRANTTQAVREGDHYRLTGHKWFCSAPMSDGFLTLAQAPEGLTCFLVPRWLEGTRNTLRLQRLKDKLGNRANASAEIEYDNTLAYRLGEEGAGVKVIIEMVHHTRLDTALAPAGLMRAALAEAAWWAGSRRVFQKTLIDQPLMAALLADLALDQEGATALGMAAAAAFDGVGAEDRAFARIAVALAKYLSNKLCPLVIVEAMEVLGGMGYVEETPMPMLYREAPLNGIWEGSGNVICLDILRSLHRDPAGAEALMTRLRAAKGADRHFDAALDDHLQRWPKGPTEAEARWFAESLAQLLAAAELIRHAPAAVADGYCATRLGAPRGRLAGATGGLDSAALLARLTG
ncbi:acyl-CoA dehydrogenase family protein [Pseudooceanicola aestuarii]|uniref:acyl-CoA dehydrogenase family protein n=1 Tax=Pseudooceanicola aestuarii TaxID=2697319 RepID=UPI0013D154FE|nr:acyl-CoA dehydrogenase family protein [Pseudooceanicola aestuarii]